ncbi:hypothetical protein [Micromonospora sp. U21]|uniref:hypothetical protein n=1 Tax=Micromonospora sp. U21 TaxID=2824899 RepID=UPI001B383C36|nr:hypothetical protein [Micromonospora sp. U21]MBQ0905524.1 hypothetical protein [Micromonospora sp. U21]
MNVFDLSPAQIRNRLILQARRAALAAEARQRPGACAQGLVGVVSTVPVTRVPVIPRVGVVPGDVVRLAESDYRYADGPLRLRIVRVRLDVSEWYGGRWVWLEGVEIGPDDQGRSFRQALARVAALRPEEDQQGPTDSVTRASP